MGWMGAFGAKNSDATSFSNFCTSSARFAPRFVWQTNSPKCTQIVWITQNISLGSNGVDWVRSLRKILTRLRGTNFCTSSARFAPSFVRQPNDPKCTQIVRNAPKQQFRVQWGGWVSSVRKILTRLHSRTFAQVRPILHRDLYGNQTVPNAPK